MVLSHSSFQKHRELPFTCQNRLLHILIFVSLLAFLNMVYDYVHKLKSNAFRQVAYFVSATLCNMQKYLKSDLKSLQ